MALKGMVYRYTVRPELVEGHEATVPFDKQGKRRVSKH